MSTDKIEIFEGSGNVYADIGVPDAEAMLLRSSIVIELRRLIEARGLSPEGAATLLGMGAADLSKVLRGNFRGYSVDSLIGMLTALGQDVEIVVHPKAGEVGQISFRPMT